MADNPYQWSARTVSGILSKLEYLGHMVSFKTRKPSYKSKRKGMDACEAHFIRAVVLKKGVLQHSPALPASRMCSARHSAQDGLPS